MSEVIDQNGVLVEGSGSNDVELDLRFTADMRSVDVSGLGSWAITVFANALMDGSGEPVGTTTANIGSLTNNQLLSGDILEIPRVQASLNLSYPSYRTCPEVRFVCGRLQRRETSYELATFSLGGNTTACVKFSCIGKLAFKSYFLGFTSISI